MGGGGGDHFLPIRGHPVGVICHGDGKDAGFDQTL